MKVVRTASSRFRGFTSVVRDQSPDVQWRDDDQRILLRVYCEPSEHGNTKYDFDIEIDLADFGYMVDTVAERAVEKHPAEVRAVLKRRFKSLVKLLGYACEAI